MSEVEIDLSSPRDDVIKTAVSFLLNPRVRKASTSQKESFLRSKGLTAEEIRIAFERSVAAVPPKPFGSDFLITPYPHAVTPFQRFRDILHTATIFIGAAYGIYYFFKRVIIPFLFGKPKPDGLEMKINELSDSINDTLGQLKTDVQQISTDLDRVTVVQVEEQRLVRNLGDLKSELATIKGILLSRHQFPTVSLTGSTSIPAWQMAACREAGDSGDEGKSIDAGHPNSNGGSQGSDSSSLEMIKEVEAVEVEP